MDRLEEPLLDGDSEPESSNWNEKAVAVRQSVPKSWLSRGLSQLSSLVLVHSIILYSDVVTALLLVSTLKGWDSGTCLLRASALPYCEDTLGCLSH